MDDDQYLDQLMNQVEALKTDNLTQRGQPKGRYDKLEPDQKRIGRSTRYGNEFVMDEPHPDTGLPMTRDDACDLFKERVLPNMDVEELRGKILICCKLGERCHGDAIINKLHGTSIVNVRTLDDVATDVRSNLNKTVEGIIGAGKALQEGRDLHPSDQAFGNWCANEFPELGSRTRSNMMQIARRFGQHLNAHQLGYSVLAELAAPSVSDDVVEQVINAPTPMKLAEVKALKKGVSTGQSEVVAPLNLVASSLFGVMTNVQLFEETNNTAVDPTELERAIRAEMHIYGERSHDEVKREVEGLKRVIDLVEQSLQDIPVSKPNLNVVGQEEADLISYQKQKQMEANPQQFDLLEHVKSTKHYDLNETARCLNISMEHLHWKSDRSEIKDAIRAAVIDDVIGIKVPALHGIAEILRELADELPITKTTPTKLN